MLLLETKSVAVGETVVKLYSVDGKLWVSRPADVRLFKLRRHYHEEILKRWVSRLFPDDG